MNQPNPNSEELEIMREFLARVVRTPISEIRITGNKATDENTDLVRQVHDGGFIEKLDPVRAIGIDSILAGELETLPDGSPDLARGAALFAQFLAERVPPNP